MTEQKSLFSQHGQWLECTMDVGHLKKDDSGEIVPTATVPHELDLFRVESYRPYDHNDMTRTTIKTHSGHVLVLNVPFESFKSIIRNLPDSFYPPMAELTYPHPALEAKLSTYDESVSNVSGS